MNITLSLQELEGRGFKERESNPNSYIYLLFNNPTWIEYGFPVLTRNNLEYSKRKTDRQNHENHFPTGILVTEASDVVCMRYFDTPPLSSAVALQPDGKIHS